MIPRTFAQTFLLEVVKQLVWGEISIISSHNFIYKVRRENVLHCIPHPIVFYGLEFFCCEVSVTPVGVIRRFCDALLQLRVWAHFLSVIETAALNRTRACVRFCVHLQSPNAKGSPWYLSFLLFWKIHKAFFSGFQFIHFIVVKVFFLQSTCHKKRKETDNNTTNDNNNMKCR